MTLTFCFQTLCFRNEHKDLLFCELELENYKIFISISLNLGHLKS